MAKSYKYKNLSPITNLTNMAFDLPVYNTFNNSIFHIQKCIWD